MTPATRLRIMALILVWAAWEALARSGLVFEGVVPSSLAVLAAAGAALGSAAFYTHLGRSAETIAFGFVIGTGVGVAVGMMMGMSAFLGRTLHPYIHVLAPTPKIIFLPILMILFGVDIGSKIAMGAISAFFPVVVATYDAVRHVPPVFVRVARSFGTSRLQLVTKVLFPAMLPAVATGMRLGLGVAIIGTLLAEIKLSNRGLGFLVIQQYEGFHIPDLYAVLLITFAFAVAANMAIGRLAMHLQRHR
ncbi:MAG: ABC transporter permease [Burkholderiales bacterium]|nr:ABC transporter permease [Burkholderiales bacterium]